MVSNSGNTYRLAAYISMLVIMGSGVACAAPEAMPTGTLPPLVTPTPPPLATPTPTPTPLPPVSVELWEKVDSAGMLLEDVEVISADGVAILHLAKGIKVLDTQGQPLDSITVTARRPQAGPEYLMFLSGLAYDFSPGGATFNPPARLIMSYDSSLIIYEAEESTAQMGYFDEAESTWTWLDSTADLDNDCVTAEIDHLGSFIVSFVIWYSPPVS